MKATHVKSVSYLKNNVSEIVTELTESREPMLITQNGEAKLVVLDAQSYEDQQQTMALLKILAMGQKSYEAGHHRPIEEFFAELDAEDGE